MYTFCNNPGGGGRRLPIKRDGNARSELLKEPFRGTNVFWVWLEFFSPLRCTNSTTINQSINQSINQVYFSLFCLVFFLHLLDNENKLREYWLPRITDKLIMIGSQFIHMFTTSLGRHTL